MTDKAQLYQRIAELEYAVGVNVERATELEEMLTAATDTAVQRGKALDLMREYLSEDGPEYSPIVLAVLLREALDGLDEHWQGGHPWSVDGG